MRLTGWRRLGIIASVLWFLVGFYWGNETGLGYGKTALEIYSVCINEPNLVHFPYCSDQFHILYTGMTATHWQLAWAYGLVPIPFGWLLAWLVIVLIRWVRRGFH